MEEHSFQPGTECPTSHCNAPVPHENVRAQFLVLATKSALVGIRHPKEGTVMAQVIEFLPSMWET